MAKELSHKPINPKHVRSAQDSELDDLFESVVEEIEDRQAHLQALGDEADQVTKDRLKNEIVDRIADLQKIRTL